MTALSDAFREIAERHLLAAKATLGAGLPEVAVFHSYHAFESIACAAVCLRETIPLRHNAKIERFLSLYRGRQFWRGTAVLASTIGRLRNLAIYPSVETDGSIVHPAAAFTNQDAANLISRVEGAVRSITSQLGL